MNLGIRLALCGVLVAGAAAGALAASHAILPADGEAARGLCIDGRPLRAGETARAAADRVATELLSRRVALRFEGAVVVEATLADLGATVDAADAARRAARVGHEGDVWQRLDDALEARAGRIDVPVTLSLPVETLAARLERLKDERDVAPRAAKLDLEHRTAIADEPGRYLDVYGAAAAIERGAAAGELAVDAPIFAIHPRASAEAVLAIDTSQVVSTFETRFGYVGGQQNRARNVARAASQMEGVVLMPGEVVSFNANVGPRSVENGFATAPEIYKGEMREGVGGGTCQVAGTLHAAAFLGGLEVVERANHSRPSGYIRMGLDATVVYPTTDLKLRNPYEFPIVVHSTIDKGTLRFQLLGRERPATVDFGTDTVGVAAFKRKVEEVSWFAPGKVKLKQKGIRGYSIKKTRVIHLRGGQDRVEVTTDVYPPTFEIYEVAPGTDVNQALPPPPGEDAPAGQVASTASANG